MSNIIVLGAGESGAGAAVLAKKNGANVLVSDFGKIADKYKAMLDERGIEWEEGRHSEERILEADLVIKSPGIPDTAPMMQKILEKGIKVVSEIEYAGWYTNAKMVCITGSNGKTTTTSLIYYIMERARKDVGLAGNIGHSLAFQVAEQPHEYYVIELSSFQLDNMYDFKADVAVLLNITPDHLDRYDFKMENYARSKMRITQNQTKADHFIYWTGDEWTAKLMKEMEIGATLHPFDDFVFPMQNAECRMQNEEGRMQNAEWLERNAAELSLKGRHNRYNSQAAALATQAIGVDENTIRQCLKEFEGVEHRLQFAGIKNGVRYINDSKATNVDACFFALESMTTPTILIIGGKDKGNDYSQIIPLVKEKCRALVYLGADNAKLHSNFDALGLPIRDTHSMKECMAACAELAHEGDTVLLSPCCASFDLFKNMEDRGEQFMELVK